MEKNQDKGFTLVELLIVIVILGILATVTVFAVRGITDKGQDNACAVEARTLETAVESFYAQNQADPEAVTAVEDNPATAGVDETVTGLVPTYITDAPSATDWEFVAAGGTFPAGLGQDGVAGGTGVDADRASGTAAKAGFYSLDGGACGGF